MHIGLIGGIGPAATEFYYRGLIDRHAAAGTAPDLTIVHADVRVMARNLANNAARQQAPTLRFQSGRYRSKRSCAGHLDHATLAEE